MMYDMCCQTVWSSCYGDKILYLLYYNSAVLTFVFSFISVMHGEYWGIYTIKVIYVRLSVAVISLEPNCVVCGAFTRSSLLRPGLFSRWRE